MWKILIVYGTKRLIGVFASLYCSFFCIQCRMFSNSGHPREPVDLVKEFDLELTVLDKVMSKDHNEEPDWYFYCYPLCRARWRTWRPHWGWRWCSSWQSANCAPAIKLSQSFFCWSLSILEHNFLYHDHNAAEEVPFLKKCFPTSIPPIQIEEMLERWEFKSVSEKFSFRLEIKTASDIHRIVIG